MGKNGFLTPKAIANKIKAKGLQKLRWYCQMCAKQCRDENGFKCHLRSEGHQRQMMLFGEHQGKYIEGFSQEFERTFLQHFRTAHRTTRISANVLYNEFIADRNHIHMNSTKWLSLSGFVQYLGRTGKCKVEETPKGWFMTLIQKDPDEELHDKLKEKRKRAEEADEVRHNRELKAQIERAKKLSKTNAEEGMEATELNRDKSSAPVGFGFKSKTQVADAKVKNTVSTVFDTNEEARNELSHRTSKDNKTKSALDEIMEEQEAAKARQMQSKCWLVKNIIVKILSKELKEAGFYKEKAIVIKVVTKDGRYVGEVEHMKTGTILHVDQAQLETVLPREGGKILIVNGTFRGETGILLGINTNQFKAEIEISGGVHNKKRKWLDYEDICKLS